MISFVEDALCRAYVSGERREAFLQGNTESFEKRFRHMVAVLAVTAACMDIYARPVCQSQKELPYQRHVEIPGAALRKNRPEFMCRVDPTFKKDGEEPGLHGCYLQ